MSLRFTELPAAAAAADYLARCVADDLRAVLDRKPRAVLAVSGGKSPVPFFHALSRADLDWPRVGIVLADERLVPNGHADSNAALVRRHLLQNRAVSAVFVPMVADGADEGSLNNGQAAAASAAERFLPPDVLVLGMGADGHTASIFPAAPQFAEAVRADNPQPLVYVSPPAAPHGRISMTLAAILRVPQLYLAIAGGEKLAVFRRAEKGVQPQYPISHVLNSPKANIHVLYCP